MCQKHSLLPWTVRLADFFGSLECLHLTYPQIRWPGLAEIKALWPNNTVKTWSSEIRFCEVPVLTKKFPFPSSYPSGSMLLSTNKLGIKSDLMNFSLKQMNKKAVIYFQYLQRWVFLFFSVRSNVITLKHTARLATNLALFWQGCMPCPCVK